MLCPAITPFVAIPATTKPAVAEPMVGRRQSKRLAFIKRWRVMVARARLEELKWSVNEWYDDFVCEMIFIFTQNLFIYLDHQK